MIKKRYGVPALILGFAMLGGSSVYAFGPRGFDVEAFSSFTTEQQSALQEANQIREAAETEAQAVLDAAGISQEELHDAMEAYHEKQRTALDDALDANDYDTYARLIEGSPMADKLTEDIFAKLVEIRKLDEAGDHDDAMELRKELKDSGFMGPGGFGGHGSKGPRPGDDTAK